MTDRGNCFAVAAGLCVDDTSALRAMHATAGVPFSMGPRSPFRIVHGTPIGAGGNVAGKRFWHAWVELAITDPLVTLDGFVVLDYSNDHETRVARAHYYAIGQLDESMVWRFTPAEAVEQYRRHRHCGPWVDGWETMADGDKPRYARTDAS